jgi:hypothetical protein
VGAHNYIHENFGLIRIDWAKSQIHGEIRGLQNQPVLAHALDFSELQCPRR